MNNEKKVEFVNRLIDMTINNMLEWRHYYDGVIDIKDDNMLLFHTEYCMLDSSKSYYTLFESHFIILVFEISESGKDGTISKAFRLLLGEPGKHGYISELKFENDPYALLSELSYHIKDSICNTDEKAEAFIDYVLKS